MAPRGDPARPRTAPPADGTALHLVPDQREVIRKPIQTIRQFTGKPPRGWLGPGLTETWETLDMLAEEGIENDIPMMLVQHHEAEELFDRARDRFGRLYAEGPSTARLMRAETAGDYGMMATFMASAERWAANAS